MTGYLQKHALFPARISIPAEKDLGIIVVIPCYDEPDLMYSLESLYQADRPSCAVEILIVINDSEKDGEKVKQQNIATLEEARLWASRHRAPGFDIHTLHFPDLPAKKAGVGLARKIGMDEAVYRFESIGRTKGIIVSFDADSLCSKNYFAAIEAHFLEKPDNYASTIYFEHPLAGTRYARQIYTSIISYELHLRYYIHAKRFAGFPYAYQTIGSAMAVRCDAYQQEGGMNKRKAGEDFYFLNKFMSPGRFSEIRNAVVYPAPRVSHRVPFGTGKAISEMLESGGGLTTYHPEIFVDLRKFLIQTHGLFSLSEKTRDTFLKNLPPSVQSFLYVQQFASRLSEIQSNTSTPKTFENRFYRWFNPFLLMKFVHHARDGYYPNIPVETAAKWLLETHFGERDVQKLEAKELLMKFRRADNQPYHFSKE